MELRLEVVTLVVKDIDIAKEFYVNKLGFHTDMDVQVTDTLRFVQLTAPGSKCSIHLSVDESIMPAGSLGGVILVVDDAKRAKEYLDGKGIATSDIDELGFGKHVYFSDPDGNSWIVQESYAQNQASQRGAKR